MAEEKQQSIPRRIAFNLDNRKEFAECLVELLDLILELDANSAQYKNACDLTKRLMELRTTIIEKPCYQFMAATIGRTYNRASNEVEDEQRVVCNRCGRQVKKRYLKTHQKLPICIEIYNERRLTALRGKVNAVFVQRKYIIPVKKIEKWWIKNRK